MTSRLPLWLLAGLLLLPFLTGCFPGVVESTTPTGETAPSATDEPQSLLPADPGSPEASSYCEMEAPTDLVFHMNEEGNDIISWKATRRIVERFDPGNGFGMYRIELLEYPDTGEPPLFVAETAATEHRLPWFPFEDGSKGQPAGNNFGTSLSELPDGEYLLTVAAFNRYVSPEGEVGWDCQVLDGQEALVLRVSPTIIEDLGNP